MKIDYEERIRDCSFLRFLIGLVPRTINYLKFQLWRWVAIKRGALIGKNTFILRKLAVKANSNLTVGSYSSIGSADLDLRGKIKIGNNVIIGSGVEIITASHNHSSPFFEAIYYSVEIADYAWLATDCTILPNARRIGYGAICGAKSVVAKEVDDLDIVVGNPARSIGRRKCVHDKLAVEFLMGFDLIRYVRSYFQRKGNEK
jgi:acetyltransferase-like isoleucine patch superfamily enzyme